MFETIFKENLKYNCSHFLAKETLQLLKYLIAKRFKLSRCSNICLCFIKQKFLVIFDSVDLHNNGVVLLMVSFCSRLWSFFYTYLFYYTRMYYALFNRLQLLMENNAIIYVSKVTIFQILWDKTVIISWPTSVYEFCKGS